MSNFDRLKDSHSIYNASYFQYRNFFNNTVDPALSSNNVMNYINTVVGKSLTSPMFYSPLTHIIFPQTISLVNDLRKQNIFNKSLPDSIRRAYASKSSIMGSIPSQIPNLLGYAISGSIFRQSLTSQAMEDLMYRSRSSEDYITNAGKVLFQMAKGRAIAGLVSGGISTLTSTVASYIPETLESSSNNLIKAFGSNLKNIRTFISRSPSKFASFLDTKLVRPHLMYSGSDITNLRKIFGLSDIQTPSRIGLQAASMYQQPVLSLLLGTEGILNKENANVTKMISRSSAIRSLSTRAESVLANIRDVIKNPTSTMLEKHPWISNETLYEQNIFGYAFRKLFKEGSFKGFGYGARTISDKLFGTSFREAVEESDYVGALSRFEKFMRRQVKLIGKSKLSKSEIDTIEQNLTKVFDPGKSGENLDNIILLSKKTKDFNRIAFNNKIFNVVKAASIASMGIEAVSNRIQMNKQANEFIQGVLNEMTSNVRKLGIFGNNMISYAARSEEALTERQRAISAIQNAHLNARYYIGQEAKIRYQSEGY